MDSNDRVPMMRASLQRMPDGVFKAEYIRETVEEARAASERTDPAMAGETYDPVSGLADSHIGTERASVVSWVEEVARGLGYAGVAWEDETQAPAG